HLREKLHHLMCLFKHAAHMFRKMISNIHACRKAFALATQYQQTCVGIGVNIRKSPAHFIDHCDVQDVQWRMLQPKSSLSVFSFDSNEFVHCSIWNQEPVLSYILSES